MKNYKFSTHVLARMPLLNGRVTENNYVAILQRKDFRAALFLASRSFYNELSKKDFDYALLTDKQKQAIKKYINRARFRSTPFGLFASVSLIEWGVGGKAFDLEEPMANMLPDFRILYELWERQLQNDETTIGSFGTNASLYMNSVDYRYFKKVLDGSSIRFSMVSVEKDRLLKSLLKFCKTPKTWEAINCFLIDENIPPGAAKDFIGDLISEQLLVPRRSPNITGSGYTAPEYFKCSYGPATDGGEISQMPGSNALAYALSTAARMDHYLDKPDNTNYFYCISERRLNSGSLSRQYQECIEEGVHCLAQLSQSYVNNDLRSFVKAFEKKYESEEIPLLEALDPQFGIGYGGLHQIKANYGFASTGFEAENTGTNPVAGENALASWLFSEGDRLFEYGREFEITDQHLQHLKGEGATANPAPSISVLFRTLDDKVCIESAGGISALGLIGRFSVLDNVYQHAQNMAKEEQLQNKNVIFAEIAHLCNLHTANINRRPIFYDYEIPVLTGSVLPPDKQIQLVDIMVSVREGMVRLRSKKLKKLIIPRLSSAFNYSRNDLPVFRFLCDLQGQGIDAALNFSIPAVIPGLPFYPRVIYKSCILQLAEWHLDTTEWRKLQCSKDSFSAFQRMADSIRLPKYFSYCVGDNFLVFSREEEEDIELLLKETEQQKKVILKEFPFIDAVKGENYGGHRLLPQYIAGMVLQKEVYHQGPVPGPQLLKTGTNDWVYFKLYCHPLSSDIILMHHLFPLIAKLKKDRLLLNWFWVRYNDPEYHLRIRVRVKPGSKEKTIRLFSTCLEKLRSGKLAGHFQTDRYKREVERYSTQLIGQVEGVFQASSEGVAAFLNSQSEMNYEDPGVILHAVLSGAVILDAFAIHDRAGFCKKAFEGFFAEFGAPKDLKSEMEKLYRGLEREMEGILFAGAERKQFDCLIESINTLVAAHRDSGVEEVSLEKLALDIIHMHLNRLFIYNQRYFEMVHYYLLQRTLYKHLYKSN